MRRTKYFLNTKININEDEIEPWIEIQPISEHLIPDHKKEEYKEAIRFSTKKLVMCIIGTRWVVIPADYITERN